MPILELAIVAGYFSLGNLLTAVVGGIGTGIGMGIGWKVGDAVSTKVTSTVRELKNSRSRMLICSPGNRTSFITIVKFLKFQGLLSGTYEANGGTFYSVRDGETDEEYVLWCNRSYSFIIVDPTTSKLHDIELTFKIDQNVIEYAQIKMPRDYTGNIIAYLDDHMKEA